MQNYRSKTNEYVTNGQWNLLDHQFIQFECGKMELVAVAHNVACAGVAEVTNDVRVF